MIAADVLIKECRKRKGYTYEQLAKKSGYSKHSICNWENGRHSPTYESLVDVLEACGFTLILDEMEKK